MGCSAPLSQRRNLPLLLMAATLLVAGAGCDATSEDDTTDPASNAAGTAHQAWPGALGNHNQVSLQGSPQGTTPRPLTKRIPPEALQVLHNADPVGLRLRLNDNTGAPELVQFLGDGFDVAIPSTEPQAKALEFMRLTGSVWGLESPGNEVTTGRVHRSDAGFTTVRVRQHYNGIPVHGTGINVMINPAGRVWAVNGFMVPGLDLDVTPRIAEADLPNFLDLEPGTFIESTRLIIYSPGYFQENGVESLVWMVFLLGPNPSRWRTVFVDAITGRVLREELANDGLRRQVFEEDQGMNWTINGEVLKFDGGGVLVFPFGTLILDDAEGPFHTEDNEARDALEYSGIFDSFLAQNGVNTYSNIKDWKYGDWYKSVVHSNNTNHAMAIHPGPCNESVREQWVHWTHVAFSDDMVTLDVAAHEWTHLTICWAGETSSGGSSHRGALHEGLSDLVACMVDSEDWEVGEDIPPSVKQSRLGMEPPHLSEGLRIIDNPRPGYRTENRYFVDSNDLKDRYRNSTIISYAGYLFASDGDKRHRDNGIEVRGVGRRAAAKVILRGIAVKFTSNIDFRGAREAFLLACQELVASNDPDVTPAVCQSLKDAFRAVGICDCSGGPCCEDGCYHRPTNHKCLENATTEYFCKNGSGCGQDVFVRHQDRYCSGASEQCDGDYRWDTPTVFDDCAPDERCTPGDSTCDFVADCTCFPNCSGRRCGDDGCGGSCGTCPTGYTCRGGDCLANATPLVAVTPTKGAKGTSFRQQGSGFLPGTATLHLRKPDGSTFPVVTQSVASNGSFTRDWSSSSAAQMGTYEFWAVDGTGRKSNAVRFIVYRCGDGVCTDGENPTTCPADCFACPPNDRCLNMGCSEHNLPPDGGRFKTPATGTTVYYGRAGYKHSFVNEACYFRLFDSWDGIDCIGDAFAGQLTTGPGVCSEGAFFKQTASPTVYRLESGRLRPLCGYWTPEAFQARWGFPFGVIVPVDDAHWPKLTAAYPVLAGNGIYPPGRQAPKCGDPGFECGNHDDGEGGFCHPPLQCGTCSFCGDGTCDADEACDRCVPDCGSCRRLVPGSILAPSHGQEVPNNGFDVNWSPGYEVRGEETETGLYCRRDGGPWENFAGFGEAPPLRIYATTPGQTISCKVRTRLVAEINEWVDSTLWMWTTSKAYPDIDVVSAALRATPPPNGCEDHYIDATFRNSGDQEGTWRARAWLHPSGSDAPSPQAIEARWPQIVTLEPGTETTLLFRIAPSAPLPLEPGLWEVTIEVTDDFNEGVGTPDRKTFGIHGDDDIAPSIERFKVYAFAGAPPEVVPGTSHKVQVKAVDDYHIADWVMDWRVSGGSWTNIPLESSSAPCRISEIATVAWAVPDGLEAGQDLELRLRVRDLADHETSEVLPFRTRSNAAPAVTFLKPDGGESYTVSTTARPTCVPIEFMFDAGAGINSIGYGLTNTTHSQHVSIKTITKANLPSIPRVQDCIEARHMGNELRLYVRVGDLNGVNHYFYSDPITIDFVAPGAPWARPFVEPTQHVLPDPPYDSASSWFGFSALRREATGRFSLVRWDERNWDDGSVFPTPMHVEMRFARLEFSWPAMELLDTHSLLPPTDEAGDGLAIQDTWNLRNLRVSDDFEDIYLWYYAPTGTDCDNPTARCDWEVGIREVVDGVVTERIPLANFEEASWLDIPFAATRFRGTLPGANPISHLIWTRHMEGEARVTTLFGKRAAPWAPLALFDPGPIEMVRFNDRVHLLVVEETADGSEWRTLQVDPATGAVQAEVSVPLELVTNYDSWFAVDAIENALYLVAWNPSSRHLMTFRYHPDGNWQPVHDQVFGTYWRGEDLSDIWVHAVHALEGRLYLQVQVRVTGDGGAETLLASAGADEEFNLQSAFVDRKPFEGDPQLVTVLEEGRLLRGIPCYWNLEWRLCLQLGFPLLQDCHDGNPCTEDHWDSLAGTCSNTPVVCPDDGDPCNGQEHCHMFTGVCISEYPDGKPCDDGLFCNGTETCDPQTGACVPGSPPSMDDGIGCTIDLCNETTGEGAHEPDDARCAPAQCTTATCDPANPLADAATGCVVVASVPDSDGLDCTNDVCDPETGMTVFAIEDNFCVIDGVCRAAGTTLESNPCLACTPEVSKQAWEPTNQGMACDDGLFCTVSDRCFEGVCVGVARNCSSLVTDAGCQTAHCDEAEGVCQVTNLPADTPCGDFDRCNGDEVCKEGACGKGEPVTCTPKNACSAAECDPLTGNCTDDPIDCDDGDPCTTDECSPAEGCVHAPVPGCCATDANCPGAQTCEEGVCERVHCRPCNSDEDCGLEGARCVEVGDGTFCLLACLVGANCEEDATCHAVGDAEKLCWPNDERCQERPEATAEEVSSDLGPSAPDTGKGGNGGCAVGTGNRSGSWTGLFVLTVMLLAVWRQRPGVRKATRQAT